MASRPLIVVVGSVNLDLVAVADKLPQAGETVTGATLERFPGGKGANQALAARRLGADVALVACVGKDAEAEAALKLLGDGGVDLSACVHVYTAPTGIALIAVAASGENQIVVAPGANRMLRPDNVQVPAADAMICQLEVPLQTLEHAVGSFAGFVSLNLAPAREVPEALLERADLLVVNETEAAFYGDALKHCRGMVAETFGARGARISRDGEVLAEASPPDVQVVDTTGAGDTFTAALTVALVADVHPGESLRFACTAGALAATKAGAQPSLPFREEVETLLQRG